MPTLLAALALATWVYLVAGRAGFWLVRERTEAIAAPEPAAWPSVVAVIPARDEADMLPATLPSLLRQDYPGSLRILLVDDHSSDGTAEAARAAAAELCASDRLETLAGAALPPGWTGKLWALAQGVAAAQALAPDFLLLSDADIAYGPSALRRLTALACARRLALTSVMAKLNVESAAERLLIPAFVFFFRMLYPFSRVNDPRSSTAAAAGGCMLVDREALRRAGGLEPIRSALIDDCALGARLKRVGPVWLGLSDEVRSLRRYPGFGDIARMVVRSAYAQLRYSPLLLALCAAGMALAYFVPPLLALFGSGPAAMMAGAAWLLMALAFAPMLVFYRRSILWGPALPLIAGLYLWFTFQSALEHRLGRGGMWKGRAQAIPEG